MSRLRLPEMPRKAISPLGSLASVQTELKLVCLNERMVCFAAVYGTAVNEHFRQGQYTYVMKYTSGAYTRDSPPISRYRPLLTT